MKNLNLILLIFIMLNVGQIFSQDSLHYVRSFYGTSRIGGMLYYAEPAGDINADGKEDFTIYYGTAGYPDDTYPPCHTDLYYGSEDLLNLKPAYVFYNAIVYPNIGDVNHDGYDDILVAETDSSYIPPYIMPKYKVYFGGKQIDTIAKFIYRPPYYWRASFHSVGKLGDINGDGYDDFAFIRPTSAINGSFGQMFIFLGGRILENNPVLILNPPFNDTREWKSFATQATGIGDINKDGYDDFIVNGGGIGDSGRVFLYYGGSKLNNQPAITLTNPFLKTNYGFGELINNAGDLNKDGRNELIVNAGQFIYIYFGLDSIMTINMTKYGGSGAIGIASGGDINGDGYCDFLLGNTNHLNSSGVMVGQANLFYGKSILDSTENYAMEGTDKWFEYSMFMSIPGDINGDGCDEVFIQEPNWPDYNKSLGKVNLYSYKKITGIDDNSKEIKPSGYELLQNFPNPFNSETIIAYKIPIDGIVKLKLYDLLGREIKELVNEYKSAGQYSLRFNAVSLVSGTYIYKIQINEFYYSRKMQIVK